MNKEINELIRDGKLIQVVILDTEGMIVEAVGDRYDSELLTSLFFHFKSFIENSQENLKLDRVEEVSLRTEKEQLKITLRYFMVERMEFFLIAVCPITRSSHQTTDEVIQMFQERLKGILGEHILPKSLHATEENSEKEEGVPSLDYEKEMIGPLRAAGLSIDIRDEVEKIKEEIKKEEFTTGDNNSSEISEKAVDLISYKIFNKLSSNIVERMVQKIILQIANNLKNIAEEESKN
jgi:hypothetical protein